MLVELVSVTSVASMFSILLFAHLFIHVIRRRYFHAFSSVPGPWLNSVTELPATIALVTGNQHIYYRDLHETYGPVVRVSPDELAFVSVEAREEIYGLRKGGLNMEKSPIFLGAVGGVNGHTGLSLALNADHARQRKALGYLFTNSAMLQQEKLLSTHIQKFIDVLKRNANERKPLDVSSWYTYLAFDVMGELCFAEPFGCLDNGSATSWSTSVINVFIAATWTQGVRRISGVGTWLEYVLTKIFVPSKAAEWRATHLNNSREKTLRRLANKSRDHPDFIHHILVNNESKKSLSETEIILNIALFISAGTDTTATALTGWTYFICTHSEVYDRLRDEARTLIQREDDIMWEKVKDLKYLEATIHEALRLFPPSPASQQRIVPPGGATIDGYHVPAGKTVAVSPWSSTHWYRNFRDPDQFRPERWLPDNRTYADDQLKASLPFGTGPRVCIGRHLAYLEMRLIAAHIIWHFDMHLDRHTYRQKNDIWGLDGHMKPMKVFHSMTKPELWVQLSEAQH